MFKKYHFSAIVLLCFGMLNNKELHSPKKSNKFITRNLKRTIPKRYTYIAGEFAETILPLSQNRTNEINTKIGIYPIVETRGFKKQLEKQLEKYPCISIDPDINFEKNFNNLLNLFSKVVNYQSDDNSYEDLSQDDTLRGNSEDGHPLAFDNLHIKWDVLLDYCHKFLSIGHYKRFRFPERFQDARYKPEPSELKEEINDELTNFKLEQRKITEEIWPYYQQKMFYYINNILDILSLLDEGLNFSIENPYFQYFSKNNVSTLSLGEKIMILEDWKQYLQNLQKINYSSDDLWKKQCLVDFKYTLYKVMEELSSSDCEDIYKENAFQVFFKNYRQNVYDYFRGIGSVSRL